ncbi:chaperonin CPN60-1, mitochondrial [Triticum aestivum]|uniref:chaperonin CPN60-1, mitochondrial n=1 Tax=Triticum aestivum TaxID=4565 RepID=UPI001D018EAB|nr:chaperonin CPN60-1, mitochondrial-like [Triticum aestivum]
MELSWQTQKYKGRNIVPQAMDQGPFPTCVLYSFSKGEQMEIHRAFADMGIPCDIWLNPEAMIRVYLILTSLKPWQKQLLGRSVELLSLHRPAAAAWICKYLGVQATSSRWEGTKDIAVDGCYYHGYTISFDDLKALLDSGKPVLAVLIVGPGFEDLEEDEIYTCKPQFNKKGDLLKPFEYHMVVLTGYGKAEKSGLEFNPFLNSYGVDFGKKGSGRVYFKELHWFYSFEVNYPLKVINRASPPSVRPDIDNNGPVKMPGRIQIVYVDLLTKAISDEGCNSIASGMIEIDLIHGIRIALDDVATNLEGMAREIITSDDIAQVATISANGETKIGNIIANVIEMAGKEGVIVILDGNNICNEYETMGCMELTRGYTSPHFVNNHKNRKCELDNPLILIHDKKLSKVNAVKALELAHKKRQPLLIVAYDVDVEALSYIVDEKLIKCVKVCVVKAPGYGRTLDLNLCGLATLTGGEIFTEDNGMSLEYQMLGKCDKVIVSNDNCVILAGAGDEESIKNKTQELKNVTELSTSYHHDEKTLVKLYRRAVIMKVGGASKEKVVENREMVADALSSTRAAIKEGIVAGDGAALLYASKFLDNLHTANIGQQRGVQIVQNALKTPVYDMASIAGKPGDVIVQKLLEQDNSDLIYDATQGEYVDMVKASCIDTVGTVKRAMMDVKGEACLMISTHASVLSP